MMEDEEEDSDGDDFHVSFDESIPPSPSLIIDDDDNESSSSSDAADATQPTPTNYEFEGVQIKFPYKAYKCQEEMMTKILMGVQNRQHCLLESPTGTGKTAALLCALLAWQESEEKNSPQSSPSSSPPPSRKPRLDPPGQDDAEPSSSSSSSKEGGGSPLLDENEEKNLPIIYYTTRTHSQIQNVVTQLKHTAYSKVPMAILASRQQTCINPGASGPLVDEACEKLRTALTFNEKLLADDPRRMPTCKFYKPPTKMGGMSVPACSEFRKFPHDPSRQEAMGEPWDIEELKGYGQSHALCPYYGTKVLQKISKIVFCPYNYVLYPYIRKACQIELKDNIIVFDESHNIEDVCRTVGSKVLSLNKIDLIIKPAVEEALSGGQSGTIPLTKRGPLENFRTVFTNLSTWLLRQSQLSRTELRSEGYIKRPSEHDGQPTIFVRELAGQEFLNIFKGLSIGPEDLAGLWSDYYILEDRHFQHEYDPETARLKVDKKAMREIARFFSVLGFLFGQEEDVTAGPAIAVDDADDAKNYPRLEDYKIVLILKKYGSTSSSSQPQTRTLPSTSIIELHLLCLNPAIAFSKMRGARTIIVTSGTLSPIKSFASELGLQFPHQLSASHVLGPDRVFTALIGRHREGSKILDFSYNNLNRGDSDDPDGLRQNFEYHQRDLGLIIMDVCRRVQYGVLVFVPSKSFLNRLMARWVQNEIYDDINDLKQIFLETDATNETDLKFLMKGYLQKIKESPKGAILFAIIRGRVSEGVDFKDDQARAVITVGIPFLPYKDEAVRGKKSYNDKKRVKLMRQRLASTSTSRQNQSSHIDPSSLLTGTEWYQTNAFRALNQAFGRCLRHSRDWGVIIVVDARLFKFQEYFSYLSGWVKEGLEVEGRQTEGSLEVVLPHLDTFLGHLQQPLEEEDVQVENEKEDEDEEMESEEDDENVDKEKEDEKVENENEDEEMQNEEEDEKVENEENENAEVENEKENAEVENEKENAEVENEKENAEVENEKENAEVENEKESADVENVENEKESAEVENEKESAEVENVENEKESAEVENEKESADVENVENEKESAEVEKEDEDEEMENEKDGKKVTNEKEDEQIESEERVKVEPKEEVV